MGLGGTGLTSCGVYISRKNWSLGELFGVGSMSIVRGVTGLKVLCWLGRLRDASWKILKACSSSSTNRPVSASSISFSEYTLS